MAEPSNRQAVNLSFAWLGALVALVYCVEQIVLANTHLASIEGVALMLGNAVVLIVLQRQEGRPWAVRALCFALGSSCTIITALAIS